MHQPPLVVENKLRGLNKITLFFPPGANQVALFTGDAVRNWKRQSCRHLRRFFCTLRGRRRDGGSQLGERVETFSVAV
jgi:hypothetical protein